LLVVWHGEVFVADPARLVTAVVETNWLAVYLRMEQIPAIK